MYIYMHIRVCVHVFVDRESCASGNVCFINSIAASVANSLSLSLFCIFYHHRFRFFSRRLSSTNFSSKDLKSSRTNRSRSSLFLSRETDRSIENDTRERERESHARTHDKKERCRLGATRQPRRQSRGTTTTTILRFPIFPGSGTRRQARVPLLRHHKPQRRRRRRTRASSRR